MAALAINGVYTPVFWFAAPNLVPNRVHGEHTFKTLRVPIQWLETICRIHQYLQIGLRHLKELVLILKKKKKQWVKLIIAMKLELIFVEDLSLWNKNRSLLQELLGTSETLHYTMKAKWPLHMQLSCQRKIRLEQMVCGQSFNLNTLPSKNLQCKGDIPVSWGRWMCYLCIKELLVCCLITEQEEHPPWSIWRTQILDTSAPRGPAKCGQGCSQRFFCTVLGYQQTVLWALLPLAARNGIIGNQLSLAHSASQLLSSEKTTSRSSHPADMRWNALLYAPFYQVVTTGTSWL